MIWWWSWWVSPERLLGTAVIRTSLHFCPSIFIQLFTSYSEVLLFQVLATQTQHCCSAGQENWGIKQSKNLFALYTSPTDKPMDLVKPQCSTLPSPCTHSSLPAVSSCALDQKERSSLVLLVKWRISPWLIWNWVKHLFYHGFVGLGFFPSKFKHRQNISLWHMFRLNLQLVQQKKPVSFEFFQQVNYLSNKVYLSSVSQL